MSIRGIFSNAAHALTGIFGNNNTAFQRANTAPAPFAGHTSSQVDSIFGHLTAPPLQQITGKKAVPPDGSISFADKDSSKTCDEYVKFLNKDPQKYASQLATLERLRKSDIEYVVKVGGNQYGETAEGNTTTDDGRKVRVNIRDIGGPQGEKFDKNSRFAHELEHARQFDDGEFSFYKNAAGKWNPYPGNYDIMDEVRSFNEQLKISPQSKDTPLLSRLRAASDDDARAKILTDTYPGLKRSTANSVFGVGASYGTGYKVGDVIQDDKIFGRVAKVSK